MKVETGVKLNDFNLAETIEKWIAVMKPEGLHLSREKQRGVIYWQGGIETVTLLINIYEADGTAWYNIESGIGVVRKNQSLEIAEWLLQEHSKILYPVRFRDEPFNEKGDRLIIVGTRGPCDGVTPIGMNDILDVIVAVSRGTQTQLIEQFDAIAIHEAKGDDRDAEVGRFTRH